MAKKILLIAPLHDVPTITANKAVNDILRYAKYKNDVNIDFLWGIAANRISFNLHTTFKKYDAIFYWGHGTPTKLMGNHIFFSMISKKNIYKVKGAAMDTMACDSASGLGKYAITKGIRAYIGTTKAYYGAFPEKERDYLADWIDYTTIRQKAIIDGKSFEEAYSMFIKKATYYLKIYKANIGYRNYDWYYDTILHNINNTILLGDGNVRLFD